MHDNDKLLCTFLGGPADLAGLRVGDKVISVNGISVVNVEHYAAVEVLKACGRVLVLVVIREVTRIIPPYEQVHVNYFLNIIYIFSF
jgi:protein scribble